jgi:elongation factor G
MKEYQTSKIRNVALVGHNGSGKTTFVERALFNTGATTRMGSVQAGSAVMDFDEEEIERNSSVSAALAPIEFKGTKINMLDTPGYMDFIGEVNSSLYVADSALIFVEAVSGVEVGTEIVRQAASARDLPQIILVNKMDRDTVRLFRVMESINKNLEGNFVNLQLPIGEGPTFTGIIDLFKMEARIGEKSQVAPIPDDMVDAAQEARMALIEAAAEGDDALMEKFFEDIELTNEEIIAGLKGGMAQGLLTPILFSAPESDIAFEPVLEMLAQLMPAPNERSMTATNAAGEEVTFEVSDQSPLAAFVFKTREDAYGKASYIRVFGGTLDSDSRYWAAELDSEVRVGSLQVLTGKETAAVTKLHAGDIGAVVKLGDVATNDTLCEKNNQFKIAPVVQPNPIAAVAIHPHTQSDVAKLSQSLNRLVAEDPTLEWHTETVTHETILSGMGMTHLDIAIKKAQSKFGVGLDTTLPRVPYRESITKTNSADYTHKKQTGGAGQYGKVFLRLEPLGDDAEFEFSSEIFGGSVSAPFVSATEKGCRQALEAGPIAGYNVVGVKAIIFDGKEHAVDSKEIAFQTAGRECFKKAMMGAGPILLEPIYKATVTVPADYMGDIMGDMNSRRARVLGIDQEGTKSIVVTEVPLAEMQTYAQDLRSMTQGRGVYSMEFYHYGNVPSHLQEQIAAQAAKERDEEG